MARKTITKKRASPRKTPAKAAAREVYFKDRAALRAWLETHHESHAAIWLVYDKLAKTREPAESPQRRALTYDDIVEEALCFGWIDSVVGRVSERRAKLYFSPRKKGSVWSALNKKRVASLEERGLIAPAGRAKIDAAKRDGSWAALDRVEALEVPADLTRALRANPAAKQRFEAFPPGARKQILYWVTSAKKPETREKRIAETVRLAARNIRARA